MGKKRHKKSFYDLESHHRSDEKSRIPSISSFSSSKVDVDDDEIALQSPPLKRQRHNNSQLLNTLIEDPQFLIDAGPKAKEFAETARQLLANPDLDPTTQQIIRAMAQAAVNVGKRLKSASSTPADQSVDEINVTNSTIHFSSTLLSPTLSNTSSSSTSTTPQQEFQESIITTAAATAMTTTTENDEDILIKQLIERAMRLTQQGDVRHAQHLLEVIHKKISNKRKRAAATGGLESEKTPNASVQNDFYTLPSSNQFKSSSPEQSNEQQSTSNFCYPAPPLPPPLPSLPSESTATLSMPCFEQVQEFLSNPSELQDILKRVFRGNETSKVSPPEEYQSSHATMPVETGIPFHPYPPPNTVPFNGSQNYQHLSRLPPPVGTTPQPYNSSLAFMQGNRRSQPPLQAPDRCFSSSKTNKSHSYQQPNRSFSFSSSPKAPGMTPLLRNHAPPLTAPPLMNVNPSHSAYHEPIPSRWSINTDQQNQRSFQPFWCATCALDFPHQIAYQEHLHSHIQCNVPGCSYTASENLVRVHHQNFHETGVWNNASTSDDTTRYLAERRKNYPTSDNINKKVKIDEERHERGDVLQTRQFGRMKERKPAQIKNSESSRTSNNPPSTTTTVAATAIPVAANADVDATLLERLLAPDIRRERNMVLQCIRYIVNNDFFGFDKDHQ